MEEQIYGIINSNKNLPNRDKEILNTLIIKFMRYFDKLDIPINFYMLLRLLSSIRVHENEEDLTKNIIYEYNADNNTIISKVSDEKSNGYSKLYSYASVALEVMSTNIVDGLYTSGIIYQDEDGKSYGHNINSRLKDRIILDVIGESIYDEDVKDFYLDKVDDCCTLDDSIFSDICSIVLAKDIYTYFINGRGDLFFSSISSFLGSTQETKNFLSNIDDQKKNKIQRRKEYDMVINTIVKDNNSEFSRKVA